MKGSQIFLDHIKGRDIAALTVDGRLEDLFVESDGMRIGAIYRAVAQRPMKGQGGIFLTLPDGTGYLRQAKGIAPGQNLFVQVTGVPESGKAIPVTTKLLFKSRYVIVTPDAPGVNLSRSIRDDDERDRILEYLVDAVSPLDYGLILRSACAKASEADVIEDARAMIVTVSALLADQDQTPCLLLDGASPHELAWQEWSQEAVVDRSENCLECSGVLDQIEALDRDDIHVGQTGYTIEQTRALIAVDVNSSGDTSLAAGLKANLAMARDLPRQLRLRGLGGQIAIDPAPMAKKDRKIFDSTLKAAFRQDTVQTHIHGWTAMGLVELQRARTRVPFVSLT